MVRTMQSPTPVRRIDGQLFDLKFRIHLTCKAHVRRKFVDLHELHDSPVAAQALDHIGALYAIEAEIRGRPSAERCAVRRARSRPRLDAMHTWLQQTLTTLSQKSATAKSIRYVLNRWDATSTSPMFARLY